MKDSSTALLIRCCASDFEDALALYDTLSAISPDVYFVYAGETAPITLPTSLTDRLILLDTAFLKRADLYSARIDLARLTWQCGDIALYAAHERLRADYFWMIEPDVFGTLETFRKLFGAPLNGDFYAPLARREREQWFWYPAARQFFREVWACIFCLVAVRCAALPAMRMARVAMLRQWAETDQPPRGLPNDESFICSFLHALGCRCTDLNALLPVYSRQTMRFGMPGSRRALTLGRGGDRNLIHHPVYGGPSFARKAQQRMADHGLWYGTAFDILVERGVLPIAPAVNQLVAIGYMTFVKPRATWRRVSLKTRGVARRAARALATRSSA